MNIPRLVGLVALVVSAFLRNVDAQPDASRTDPFHYDRRSSLDVQEVGKRTAGAVTIRDVTYASVSSRHGRIAAFIVSPSGSGPFAGVFYFHWLGKPRGDRTEFLDEAIALAADGVVSVLIQGYFPWTEAPKDGATDRQQVIDQTLDARRGLDLLLAQTGVDPQRVAYVGHDYGAMFGAIVAGVDRRAKAYVFVAGMGNFGDWSLKYWPDTATHGEAAYRKALADVDPINFVGIAAPAALLFQFAKRDIYISQAVASEFFDQASRPKEVRWYDAEHDLHLRAATDDRRAWLTTQLSLRRVPAPR